jgi:mRNA interferase MazF
MCPITNQKKGYPFEVSLTDNLGVNGVILADHIKSVDWRVRQAEKIARCPGATVEEVRARLAPLLGY